MSRLWAVRHIKHGTSAVSCSLQLVAHVFVGLSNLLHVPSAIMRSSACAGSRRLVVRGRARSRRLITRACADLFSADLSHFPFHRRVIGYRCRNCRFVWSERRPVTAGVVVLVDGACCDLRFLLLASSAVPESKPEREQ